MTTPFKPSRRLLALGRNDSTSGGTNLFGSDGDSSNDDNMTTEDIESPPRSSQKQPEGGVVNLFGSFSHPQQAERPKRYCVPQQPHAFFPEEPQDCSLSTLSYYGTALRPLDMNMANSSPPQRRKRAGEGHPMGREEISNGGNEDMFISPRPEAYRTMDGRTVTSNNPFSPYTPDTDGMDEDCDMQAAPEFPLSLSCGGSANSHSTTSSNHSFSASIARDQPQTQQRPLKINLQRRDNTGTSPFKQPLTFFEQQNYGARSGFPARQGQYSFTGSPIEEVDIYEHQSNGDTSMGMGCKVRKVYLDGDSASECRRAGGLFVDTDQAVRDSKIPRDEISPTDVLSFPPPTPTKAVRPRSTPGPPHTPLMERHSRSRSEWDDDDEMNPIASSSSKQPKSRFSLDFDIIGQLGNGSFGTVYKCLSRLDGCMYAIKAAKRKAKGVADRDRMLKEVYALAALSDQADTAAFHIVRYHQAWMEENRLYIQTELCSSTLQVEMSRGIIKHEKRRYKLMREILLALEFIHRNGMVHLDIKPENIFVKNDQFKLGDFGLVSKTSNNSDVEEGDSRYMSLELLGGDHPDLTKVRFAFHLFGRFCCFQILTKQSLSHRQSDIFSFGATMYEICLGQQLPMEGQEWQAIRHGILQPLLNTPIDLEMIIKEMMAPLPENRPRPADLLKRRELLSSEQKQLIAEKHKVLEANMALALQTQRMKKLTPPRGRGLIRANTWNGGTSW
jgi:wee1-like protein kinase